MAQLVVTVPDVAVPRIEAAFRALYDYRDEIPDPGNPGTMIPNPQTVGQFIVAAMREYLKRAVINYEADTAGANARAARIQQIKDEIGF